MPIVKTEEWDKCVEVNKDPYGGAVVKVARRVMDILDEDDSPLTKEAVDELICRGDRESGAGGITGFMAGCVAGIVSQVHSRGEEFRTAWNAIYGVTSEDGVVNPAVMTIGVKESPDA